MIKTIIVNAPQAQRFLQVIQMVADATAWVIEEEYYEKDAYEKARHMARPVGNAWCDENGWHHIFMTVPEKFTLASFKLVQLAENERIEFPTAKEILFPDYVRTV